MTDQIPTKPMLNSENGASIMGITQYSFTRLCRKGEIPGAKKIGTKWYVPRDKLLEYLGIEA